MNIVMLWYQHDWGLYGRRYKMIARTWVRERGDARFLVVEPPMNPWIWANRCWNATKSADWELLKYWISRWRKIFHPLSRENNRLWVLQPFLLWPFRSTGERFLIA